MSGECDKCGEHTTDCICNKLQQAATISIWAQMFFEDGSVTQGKRVAAECLDEGHEFQIDFIAQYLLDSVNRKDGWLLLWGAGNILFNHYPTSFSNKMV